VKLPYTAGVVGVSFLPSFVALGSDAAPNAPWTFVHELGHHFARLHSPSCGAGGIDANYPYANGTIGVTGFDPVSGALKPPSTPDIMGYCDNRWISDYTFTGILGYRAAQANVASRSIGAAQPGLLIWGRIGSSGIVLEPAFEVTAPPKLPSVDGPHLIEILGDDGAVLKRFSFSGDRTVDSPLGNEEHFAFVVPIDELRGREPARIRLAARGAQRVLTTAVGRTTDRLAGLLAPTVTRLTPSRVRLRWSDAPGRGVLVRDAQTGAIIGFARGGDGDAVLATRSLQLDLSLSDGVRTARRTVQVR
jgi:hypothetical protein